MLHCHLGTMLVHRLRIYRRPHLVNWIKLKMPQLPLVFRNQYPGTTYLSRVLYCNISPMVLKEETSYHTADYPTVCRPRFSNRFEREHFRRDSSWYIHNHKTLIADLPVLCDCLYLREQVFVNLFVSTGESWRANIWLAAKEADDLQIFFTTLSLWTRDMRIES